MICTECAGIGTIDNEECGICDGNGRVCRECHESIFLASSNTEMICRDCAENLADSDSMVEWYELSAQEGH